MATPAAPICPRCGYDQSGTVASWDRADPLACPLRGVCTECGLEFRWGDLLSLKLGRTSRFYEVAEWRLRRSFLITAWRALTPWSFWRWALMEYAVNWVRMALVVGCATFFAHACASAFRALAIYALDENPIIWTFYSRWRGGGGSLWSGWDGWDRRVYWALTMLWPLGDGIGFPGWTAFTPLSLLAVLAAMFMPLTFLLLPDSLPKARVRRSHLVRIWAYGLIALPVVVSLTDVVVWAGDRAWGLIVESDSMEYSLGIYTFAEIRWWILLGLVCLWLLAWWGVACRRYLRLPHSRAVAPVMLFVSLLLSLVAIWACGLGTWFVFHTMR